MTNGVSRAEKGAIAAILVASVVLVAYDPGSYVFEMDPAELAEMGRDIAAGRQLPLTGTNVAGGEAGRWLGPLVYYAVSIPFFFSSSIYVAALFFGAFYVASVLLVWSSARALFGSRVGLVAAALFAGSAIALMELRLSFPTSMALLALLALLRACIAWGRRPAAILWVAAFAGVLIQLHVVHVAYLALVVVAYRTYRPKMSWAHLAVGVAIAVGLEVPWVIAQVETDGRDLTRMLAWIGSRAGAGGGFEVGQALYVLGAALTAPFRVPLDALAADGRGPSLVYRIAFAVLAGLSIVGWVAASFDRRWRPGLRIVATWLAGPLFLFALAQSGVYSFHMVSILPAFAILAALGAEWLTRRLGKGQEWVLAGVAVALVATQAMLLLTLSRRAEAEGYARIPMSAVLSYPDAQWRFPVDITFPTFRDVERVEDLLAARGIALDAPGRVHGPLSMALSHHPPLLPTSAASVDQDVDERLVTHVELSRGAACADAPEPSTRGPWCLRELSARLYGGWEVRVVGLEGAHQATFPARGERDMTFVRQLPSGTAITLTVWTLGPVATRMDRPTPPTVEVTLDGVAIDARAAEAGAPFWVRSTSTYSIRADAPARLAIRAHSDEPYDVDLAFGVDP